LIAKWKENQMAKPELSPLEQYHAALAALEQSEQEAMRETAELIAGEGATTLIQRLIALRDRAVPSSNFAQCINNSLICLASLQHVVGTPMPEAPMPLPAPAA
jgi:hypothetical protein